MSDVQDTDQQPDDDADQSPPLEAREREFFASNLTYSVMVLANLIGRITNQMTLQESTLGINEWRVMRMVHIFGPISAAEIILTIGMDKTTVSRTVTNLHNAGLIKLTPNPRDRRQTLISLTAPGVKMHNKIIPLDQDFDTSFEALLTPTEISYFQNIMNKLRPHAQQLLAEVQGTRAPRRTRSKR